MSRAAYISFIVLGLAITGLLVFIAFRKKEKPVKDAEKEASESLGTFRGFSSDAYSQQINDDDLLRAIDYQPSQPAASLDLDDLDVSGLQGSYVLSYDEPKKAEWDWCDFFPLGCDNGSSSTRRGTRTHLSGR